MVRPVRVSVCNEVLNHILENLRSSSDFQDGRPLREQPHMVEIFLYRGRGPNIRLFSEEVHSLYNVPLDVPVVDSG